MNIANQREIIIIQSQTDVINTSYFDNVVNMVNNIIKCNQFPGFLRSTNKFSFYNFHTNYAAVFANGAVARHDF